MDSKNHNCKTSEKRRCADLDFPRLLQKIMVKGPSLRESADCKLLEGKLLEQGGGESTQISRSLSTGEESPPEPQSTIVKNSHRSLSGEVTIARSNRNHLSLKGPKGALLEIDERGGTELLGKGKGSAGRFSLTRPRGKRKKKF